MIKINGEHIVSIDPLDDIIALATDVIVAHGCLGDSPIERLARYLVANLGHVNRDDFEVIGNRVCADLAQVDQRYLSPGETRRLAAELLAAADAADCCEALVPAQLAMVL